MNQFFLNGQKYVASFNLTVLDLIHYFGYNEFLLVVEYNYFICSRSEWSKIVIQDKDKIEIVTIVGGG